MEPSKTCRFFHTVPFLSSSGIDADEARSEEETIMLRDAKQWLNNKNIKEKKHPTTGASALHVAASKGYIKVME